MNMRYAFFVVLLLLGIGSGQAKVDYDHDSIYKVLRDSMSESFNNADEARFSRDIKKLEDYLLQKDDMHGYYTQRCNEIVFMMNTQKIFEAGETGDRYLFHNSSQRIEYASNIFAGICSSVAVLRQSLMAARISWIISDASWRSSM